MADAQGPIEKLDREHKELEREASAKSAQAQKALQDLSTSADKLEQMNKWLAKCVPLPPPRHTTRVAHHV